MADNTIAEMEGLIKEARVTLPFNMVFTGHCEGRCDECPEKLLEFLDIEILHWQSRLKANVAPAAQDVDTVRKMYAQVYGILQKKGLIKRCTT
jgi:hypothetical protein